MTRLTNRIYASRSASGIVSPSADGRSYHESIVNQNYHRILNKYESSADNLQKFLEKTLNSQVPSNRTIEPLLLELRRRFENVYHERIVQMILFGSQARNDAGQGADIDVLVVLRGEVQPGVEVARTGRIVADLSLRFNEVISCVFVNEEQFIGRNGPLLRNVRREGVSV